jgi:hypothetical protein
MSGKSPAIMQSPNDGDICFLQKTEQHLIIHIETVQRVQMDQIRLKRSDLRIIFLVAAQEYNPAWSVNRDTAL